MAGPQITHSPVNTKTTTIRTHRTLELSGTMSVFLGLFPSCYPHIDFLQDHTERQTGENVYRGLSGFYIITDEDEQALGLPTGDHDIPLSLSAKTYSPDGSLLFDTNNNTGLWGDVIHV